MDDIFSRSTVRPPPGTQLTLTIHVYNEDEPVRGHKLAEYINRLALNHSTVLSAIHFDRLPKIRVANQADIVIYPLSELADHVDITDRVRKAYLFNENVDFILHITSRGQVVMPRGMPLLGTFKLMAELDELLKIALDKQR